MYIEDESSIHSSSNRFELHLYFFLSVVGIRFSLLMKTHHLFENVTIIVVPLRVEYYGIGQACIARTST
jgi:hypothetical protein